MKRFIVLIFCVMTLSACAGNSAGKYLPDHAINTAEGGVSVPHPANLESTDVKKVTSIIGAMDSGLFTEVVYGNSGVWPVAALTTKGDLIKGYGYLVRLNPFGTWLVNVVFPVGIEDLAGAKILMFNRDGGWAYTLKGAEIGLLPAYQTEGAVRYNPKSFDENKDDYRQSLFAAYGDTVEELDAFWKRYYTAKGGDPSLIRSCAKTYVVGSPEWADYKRSVLKEMPNGYRMPDGEIRVGKMKTDDFREVSIEIPGFTPGERYIKNGRLPIASLPFDGISLGITAASNILVDGVAASINDTWSGFTDRAQVLRKQLAPAFRSMANAYQNLIFERNLRVEQLERELRAR